MELEEEEVVTTDVDNLPEETIEEEEEVSEDTMPTYADYLKLVERNKKAEAKLVELKKTTKMAPLKKETSGEPDLDKLLEEKFELKEFFQENKDATPYKEQILAYKAKGLSLEDAYLLATKGDREIEGNTAYSRSNVAGKQGGGEGVTLISIAQFDKLPPKAQEEYMETVKAKTGKVAFKG